MRHRLRFFLILSVAVNVLLVAFTGTQLLRRPDHPPRPPTPDEMIERLACCMNKDDLAIMRRSFESDFPRFEGMRAEMDLRRRAIDEALRAEPFNPVRLAAAMSGIEASQRAMEQMMQENFIATAAALSPEGRKALSEMHRGPMGGPRGGTGGPPPPRP
jgi:uncharacterized membrane protein